MSLEGGRIYYPSYIMEYMKDPFLKMLFHDIRSAGQIKASSLDITEKCNLRCKGCYYFEEKMNLTEGSSNAQLEQLVKNELARGTNYVTILGGEPSLVPDRLKIVYDNFKLVVVTNGMVKIPHSGFENLPIIVSVWGDHETDKKMRGNDKVDVFAKALQNYHNDDRAIWYFTVTSGNTKEIESVSDTCVKNGNYLSYNFYCDIAGLGGSCNHRIGFYDVCQSIDKMIDKYPDRILNTTYLNNIVASGKLYDQKWGYDVCSSITFDHESNHDRIHNGNPYNKHFRAYNADMTSTRRCCVGIARDCENCFDLWAHYSWILGSMRKHVKTKSEFTNWLTTSYVFLLISRLVDFNTGIKYMPEIHSRTTTSYLNKRILAQNRGGGKF